MARFVEISPGNRDEINSDDTDDVKPVISPTTDDQNNFIHGKELYSSDDQSNCDNQKDCHSSEDGNGQTNSEGKDLSTSGASYNHKNYDSDDFITSEASYDQDNHENKDLIISEASYDHKNHDSEELNSSEASHEHSHESEELDILEASSNSSTHDIEELDHSEISDSPINYADDDQDNEELGNFVEINVLLHKILDKNYNYIEHLENDLHTIGQLMTQEPVNLVVSLYDETDVLDLYFDHDPELSVYMSILLELTQKLNHMRSKDQRHNANSQNEPSTASPAKQPETTKELLDLMQATLEKPKQNGILEDAIEFGKILSGLLALKRGADVNTQTKHYKQTLLHCIIDTLHEDGRLYESVDLEIEASNIEPMTIIEEIGLPLRAVDGKLDLFSAVEYVLSLPNNKLLQDCNGNTPLHILARSGIYTGAMSLIYSSSQPNEDAVRIAKMMTENRKWHELNCTNKKGVTAFMSCVLHNIVEISVVLAQVSEVDVNLGATKPCKQYDYRNSLVSPQLLERVTEQWGSHIYLVPEKFTPLMVCSLFDNRQVLLVLLGRKDLRTAGQAVFSCKQNPDSVISQEISVGDTHVHLAVLNDNLDQLKFLLQALGPAAMNSCLNGDGYTILHRACHLKRINIMHFLLCKANVAAIFTDDDPLTDENYREFVNRCAEYGSAASVYYYGPDNIPYSSFLNKIFHITKRVMPLLKRWFTKVSGSERLRHISVEGFFNRVALAFIYTASCLTQFLLKLGFTHFCASTVSVLGNYRVFVECADYDISAVDNIGQSLLHIIADNGLAGLLVHAVKLRTENIVDFRQLDSNGKVPLEVAIHSTSVYSHKIVAEMATLVKTHEIVDACQNQVTQVSPRLIEIMSEYRNQSWFGATVNNLSINNLLDIYASNKPQSFWATNTASTIELDVFELQLASTNGATGTKLAQRWVPIKNGDLKSVISIAINQLHAMRQLTMDTSSFLKKYQILYNILREKFLQSTEEAFEFEFTKKKFKVSYKLDKELLQSYTYKVNITYEDIIKSIGKEWDHLAGNESSSTRDERNPIFPHSNDYIFQAQKVPFLQIILTQVSDAIRTGSTAALSMKMKKLEAFLQFPFIELEQSRDAVLGMSNSLECAPNEEVRNLLLNKLKTQTTQSHGSNSTNILSIGVDTTSLVCNIEYNKIPKEMDKSVYESLARGYHQLIVKDVKEKVKENVKGDLSDMKLYTFAELFCWRLKPNRKNYSVDFISSTLDSLARLLEVNSVCVAVAIFEGKFYISSNFGPAFCDMKDRALIRENVILAGIHLFNYMTKLANHSQNNDDTSLNDFFTDVLATTIYSNFVNNRRFKNVFPNNTKDKLIKFLHICFKQNNDIFKQARKDTKGDLVFDDNLQFVFCSCGHIQYKSSLNICCKCKETLQGKEFLKANWVTPILKFCRDLRKLKDAVKSRNPQKRLPPAIIKALKSCIKGEDMFELISNPDYLHAESALISRIMSLKGYELQSNLNIYIGISKICCPHCALFIQTLRNLSYEIDVPFFSTRGSHQSNYFWIMPRLVVDDSRILAQFLGGQESELYAYFVSLSDGERIQALNIVQHFSYDKLKEYALDDLCKILRDPQTHIQHSKPEQSLTLASTLGTCDDLKDDLPDVDPDVDQEYLFMDALYSKSSSRLTELISSANWTLDINYQHPLTKMTALHVAIFQDDPILVDLLVKKKALTTIKDNRMMVPKEYIREQGYLKNCEIIWDILYPSYISERAHLKKAKQDYIQYLGYELACTENQFGAYQIPALDDLDNSPEKCLHFLNNAIQCVALNMFQANFCDLTATQEKSNHHAVYSAFKVACKCAFKLSTGDKDNGAISAKNQKCQTSDAFEIFTTSMTYLFYVTSMLNTKCLSKTKILHLCLQTMQNTGELETLRIDVMNMLMPGTDTHLRCPRNLFAFLSYELCHQNLQDILHILEIYIRMPTKTNANVQNFRMQLLNICLQVGTILRYSSPKLQRLISTEESLIQDTLAIRHAIMHINQPQYGDPICKYLGKVMPTLCLDGEEIEPEMVIQGWINCDFDKYLDQDSNQSSSMTAAEYWQQIREDAKNDSQWGLDYLHASDCEILAEVMDSSSRSDAIMQLTLATNDTVELQKSTADLVEPLITLGASSKDLPVASASERRSDEIDNDSHSTNHLKSADLHVDKLFYLLKDFIFYSSQIEHLLKENPDSNPLDIEQFTSRNNVDCVWKPIHLELQFLQILVGRQTELIFREFRCLLPPYLSDLLEAVRDDSSSWINYCANGLYRTTLLTYQREVFFEVLFRNCHAIITASKLIQVFQYALQRNFNFEQAHKHVRSMVFKACDNFFDQLDESFSSSDNH